MFLRVYVYINVNDVVLPGLQCVLNNNDIADVALKEAMSPAFKSYQRQVVLNAKALAQGLPYCVRRNPIITSCWLNCSRKSWTGRAPRNCWRRSASLSTRTSVQVTSLLRSLVGSASAPQRLLPATQKRRIWRLLLTF